MTVTELRAKIPHADGLRRLAERAPRRLWDWRRRRREESLTGCLFRVWRAGSADHSLLRGRPGSPPPCRLRGALAAGAAGVAERAHQPPLWLDEHGQRRPTRQCWKGGREDPALRV